MVKSLPKGISTLLATLALLLVAVACDSPMALLPEGPPPEAPAAEASADQVHMSLDDMSWGEILADRPRIMALEPGQRTKDEAFIARMPERVIRSYANPQNLGEVVCGSGSKCSW